MAIPFEQTLHSLSRDDHRGLTLLAALVVVLLVGWLVIAVQLKLPTTIASERGTVVSSGAPVRLLSTSNEAIDGILVHLGETVEAQQALVRFDSEPLNVDLQRKRQQSTQHQAQLESLRVELRSLDSELANELESYERQLDQLI